MEYYLLIARSVTQAQRMQRLMVQNGIRAEISRTPMELTDGHGCSYALRISKEQLSQAMQALRGTDLRPIQIYLRDGSGYREVLP